MDPRAELNELYKEIETDAKFDYMRMAGVEFVPGSGPIDAKLMIVGEAPGRLENARKEPFIGQAGEMLVNLLEDVDIKPHECYLTNVIKYWPYEVKEDGFRKTRTPTLKEVEDFAEYLRDEIDIVQPRIVALAGVQAVRAIFPRIEKPMYKNGDLIGGKYVIVYHPVVASYQAGMKSRVKFGYARLKNHLDNIGR